MTTVAAVLDRCARECSVPVPTGWAAATRLAHVELRDDFLPETVAELLDRIDLPAPIGKQTTITGDGSESYDLPSDFRRLARDRLAVYETTTLRRAGTPVATDGAWTHLNQIGTAGSERFYAIEGYDGAHTIKFEADLSSGRTVVVSYVSNVWAKNGSTEKTAFTDEDDVILLPRRVVELGTIWRFRARKGFAYEDVAARYEAEISRLTMDSRGIRAIDFTGGGGEAKPMRFPVPDYIP